MSTELKDPVCGMLVHPGRCAQASYGGDTFYFCSEYCRGTFASNPGAYAGRGAPESHPIDPSRRIAYFSMEVGLDAMPTYSGGLGVLAGDTLRSAADLGVPMVAVSLLYTCGYFEQTLDESGTQGEFPVAWDPSTYAKPLPEKVEVCIEGRVVSLRAWRRDLVGASGQVVPLYLLDANLVENEPGDRDLTAHLYGGDGRYRLAQEIILGIGGVRMLRALGYAALERFHMNEGHAALLGIELLRESSGGPAGVYDFSGVRDRCVFTTHTPVPAGHDQFPYDLVRQVLGEPVPFEMLQMLGGEERFNMTRVALNLSTYINGVAKRHGEVSRQMFPDYEIDSITNGVYSPGWTCESFRALYDRHIPGWSKDPLSLRNAVRIPKEEIWNAHQGAKAALGAEVGRRTGMALDEKVLTIGFARRATAYKRADLIFTDVDRLAEIASAAGSIQLVFGGKAHPRDEGGKELIRTIHRFARELAGRVRVVYLAEYDIALAKLLTSGVDLWLNTPLRPLEASGTSGMKAAHNGVPSLSVLDGWWIEGHVEGVTGWSIGSRPDEPSTDDAEALYEKLRSQVIPCFYGDRERWIDVMRNAITLNASFFNTHRMVQQYAVSAYV